MNNNTEQSTILAHSPVVQLEPVHFTPSYMKEEEQEKSEPKQEPDFREAFDGTSSLYKSIEKVRILKGRVSSDEVIWEFYIKGQVIKVPATSLDTQRILKKEYLKVLYTPMPNVSKEVWDDLIAALFKNKAEIIEAPEESDEVFISRQIFEKIASMNVSSDVNDCLNGRALYNHNGLYWLPAKKIVEIVTDMKCRISQRNLSQAMTELGLKKAGTTQQRIGSAQQRCWGFVPEKVNEVKEV